MRIEINGVRLFFDVEGAKLAPDGPVMREKPTLILLHGGPGEDHSGFKPAFSRFSDIAQIIYLDHRGNGRSDAQPFERLNLAQWGDDVYAFCRALEIEKPIVMGNSFGGIVAMAYATRHPENPGKLIVSSTRAVPGAHVDRNVALFEQFGGPEVGEMARRHFTHGLTAEDWPHWLAQAMPLYSRRPSTDPDAGKRAILNLELLLNFHGPEGEGMRFNMLGDLRKIQCPTLVLGGEADPRAPIEEQEDIARAIPEHLVRFERIANAGHGPYRDDPRVFDIMREFILS